MKTRRVICTPTYLFRDKNYFTFTILKGELHVLEAGSKKNLVSKEEKEK